MASAVMSITDSGVRNHGDEFQDSVQERRVLQGVPPKAHCSSGAMFSGPVTRSMLIGTEGEF